MTAAVLSLGSNLGDRFAALQAAVTAIGAEVPVRAVSGVYETAPIGGRDQGDFLNAVVVVDAPPGLDLLALVRRVESLGDRRRGQRRGPRTIDVDVVTVGELRSADPTLTLPHPRATSRAFVLVPWLEVDPAARLTGIGAIADLLARTDATGVRHRPELRLLRPASP
jgi:dihydroneopterin aldolase/2-amino-4-hydroxy-6-hydroxymethyldihydropteridine diphosphokinase